MRNIKIRRIEKKRISGALDLAMKVFLVFEAPDYSEEGVKEFEKSIHDPDYLDQLAVYGAYADEELVGMLATRANGTHIALFFVKGSCQKQGIGKRLFQTALENCPADTMTVNSSPYAVPVYHKLGFSDMDKEQLVNGIRFTPMKRRSGNIIMTSERLFLREMKEEDFESLYALLADTDIMQHYPYTFDEPRVRGWIAKNLERYSVFGFGLWAVCLKDTGEMIGDCGLTMQQIDGNILPEIGYHIRKDMQKKGCAKEAAAAVRDRAFDHTPFQTLFSYMKTENLPSRKTASAIGMRFQHQYTDSEGKSTSVYAISRPPKTEREIKNGTE